MKGLLFFLSLFALPVQASVNASAITEEVNKEFTQLADLESWKAFLDDHPELFPKNNSEVFVKVEKKDLKAGGGSYTVGMGYRQVFIKADIQKVKDILNNPDGFRYLYGLDADSKVDEKKGDKFRARIYKKVPLVADQDYVLEYSSHQDGPVWFQRAKLVEDKKDFALRDNLKALESVEGGVIFREISMVYILKWYGKLFGPQARGIMEKELKKITLATKCAAENPTPFTTEIAQSCWQSAEKTK
jgi:hypothetical protein